MPRRYRRGKNRCLSCGYKLNSKTHKIIHEVYNNVKISTDAMKCAYSKNIKALFR